MHIAQVIDSFYYGGAQSMQIRLAEQLQKYPDINLTVISLRENDNNTPIPDQLQELGARVLYFHSRKLLDIPRLWKMIQFFRKEQIDIVHSHLPYANTIGTFAAYTAGIPAIASMRNSKTVNKRRRGHAIRAALETFVINHFASGVMAVGQATADAHQERLHAHEIQAIVNSIAIFDPMDDEKSTKIRQQLFAGDNLTILFSAGRLAEAKGYDYLIDAFAQVHSKFPNTRLAIAGGGKKKEEFQKQIDQHQLQDVIKLLGFRNDVKQLLQSVDIYVSSSRWEGVSVSILEALAAGLPTIATNVSEVPPPEAAQIVPSRQVDELAQAITNFLEQPTLQSEYSQRAINYIKEHHNPEQWMQQILTMYDTVLNNSKTTSTNSKTISS